MSSSERPPSAEPASGRLEVAMHLVYLLAILTMLAIYGLGPAPERWEFYRRSLAAWAAWFTA